MMLLKKTAHLGDACLYYLTSKKCQIPKRSEINYILAFLFIITVVKKQFENVPFKRNKKQNVMIIPGIRMIV